ncbi:putative MFS transporter, AGZA family, xanthine/uracil permease [Pedococcus dokdonensis]|uniref:Putative MFS transporter, AGZA family, xanthine/uracil permease n=1 Tax=Pedococcus dokdonensis TaxID=443156 RepID=A0A1H0SLN1_9MICO|nr:NCS2 family permease [Pedococcus dokdonensis]SDP42627.1 putative MFS transporter, AGZA family, xanthine/uracil permease [Pedococcus dokdonensis]
MAKPSSPPKAAQRPSPARAGGLDGFFRITERGSTVSREVRGGLVTFFTMAYIVVLNPLIIGTQQDGSGSFLGGGDIVKAQTLVAAGTALVAGVMTLLMGIVANYPLALATGLGLNAFVTFGIAKLPEMTWADAMGLIVIEGVIILVLVLTGFRQAVFKAIPGQLKTAISVGIGLFITIIGLVDAGFVRRTGAGPVPVELGIGGNLNGWPLLVFVIGFIAIVVMMVRKVKAAILYGILGGTVLAIIVEAIGKIGGQFDGTGKFVNPAGWGLNVPALPDQVLDVPDFSLIGDFNLLGSFDKLGFVAALLLVFTLLLADFFDTMGTMVAVGAEGGLLDEHGNPPNSDKILLVDSVAAIAGGAGSVSSNTSYIESAAGVGEGARTGLASVVTGVMFLLATFLAPLVKVVPYEAATPALVVVGFLMMQQVKGIDWDDLDIAIPAFLTIVLMPFTYSITVGIGAGFVMYTLIKVVRGKASVIHPLLWTVSALFVIYFAITPIKEVLGVG